MGKKYKDCPDGRMKSHCTVQNCGLGTMFQELEEKPCLSSTRAEPQKNIAKLYVWASYFS